MRAVAGGVVGQPGLAQGGGDDVEQADEVGGDDVAQAVVFHDGLVAGEAADLAAGEGVARALEVGDDAVEGRRRALQVAARRDERALDGGADRGRGEVVLGGEVVVEAALPHAAGREDLARARGAHALGGEHLLRGGDEAQKRKWLPKLASGEAIGTFALSEGTKAATAANLATRFDGGTVTGTKLPVLDTDMADLAVVAARDASGNTLLCLVDLKGAGVTIEPLESIDPSRHHAKVTFARAPAEPLAAAQGWQTVERVVDAAAVLFAFEQIGGAQRCLEMARDYALERHAFGRQIGSYQAIKHKLADVAVALEFVRPVLWRAAQAMDDGLTSAPLHVSHAKYAATDAAYLAAESAIQVHGAMGYTYEVDLHFWMKRAWALSGAWGDRNFHYHRIEDAALGGAHPLGPQHTFA